MERRTSAVPMDFEWQTGKGPVDERSPFHTFAVAQQQQQQGKKRPFSIFGSPSKSQPPSLREPASQMHFLFSDPNANTNSHSSASSSTVADPLKQSSPTRPHPSSTPNTNKPLPSLTASSYFRLNNNSSNAASSFATPRKLEPDICSSGPEGASSPEGNGVIGGADSPVAGGKEQQRSNAMGGGGFFGGRMLRFGGGAEKEEKREDGNDDSGNTIAGDDRHNNDGGFEFEAKKAYLESPSRRSSFFGRLGFLTSNSGSPGRGDMPKGYSTKVEKKVSKRRAATRGPGTGVGPIVTTGSDRHIEKRMVRRKATAAVAAAAAAAATNADVVDQSSGEEADESSMFLSSPQKGGRSAKSKQSSSRRARSDQKYLTRPTSSKSHKTRNYNVDSSSPMRKESILTSIFTFIETHPNVPHILSFYAQLLFNLFLIFSFMSILWSFWSTIRADVDKKAEEAIAEALAEMAVCAQNYRENRCEPETRVPAMESVCRGWETCMDRDPRMGVGGGGGGGKGGVGAGGRAVISARTFAEIFNGFVEPISYKAMIFTIIILSTSIIVSNATFAFFRNKALDSLATYSHNYYGGGQQQHYQQQQQQQYVQGGGGGGGGHLDQQEHLSLNAGSSQFRIPQQQQQQVGAAGYGRGYGYDDGDGHGYGYGYGRPQPSSSLKTPRR